MKELTIAGRGKNALGTAVMEGLLAQLRGAGDEPLLVSGAGDAFSAGLDLKEVAAFDAPGMERYLLLLDDLIDALYQHPGPTVACVNGHAIAGGCVLVLCCDHRVAIDDAAVRIGLNEVALGLEFPPKILALARRRVPPRWQERVLLDADLHPPRIARELGLVDEVVAEPLRVARERLGRLAAHPRDVYVATKRTLRAGALDLPAETRRYFRERVVPTWCAPSTKERVRAALAPRSSPRSATS